MQTLTNGMYYKIGVTFARLRLPSNPVVAGIWRPPGIRWTKRLIHNRGAGKNRMPGASMTCTAMSGNGVPKIHPYFLERDGLRARKGTYRSRRVVPGIPEISSIRLYFPEIQP